LEVPKAAKQSRKRLFSKIDEEGPVKKSKKTKNFSNTMNKLSMPGESFQMPNFTLNELSTCSFPAQDNKVNISGISPIK
jgi:hypothetical protein